jgi:hypothetical protein
MDLRRVRWKVVDWMPSGSGLGLVAGS